MTHKNLNTVVSAVKCHAYDPELLDEKLSEAVELAGGLPEQIKTGSRILIKPNLLSACKPEDAVTTHPEIVAAIVRFLKNKGINNIKIGDSPAGIHNWDNLWKTTGFTEMAEKMHVELVPFDKIKRLQYEGHGTIPVFAELENFDAVISVPKMKTHILTKITGAVKNSFGLVIGNAKADLHGTYPSPGKMAEFLAGLYKFLKPDFVIMDAVLGMEGNGPNEGIPRKFGTILAGTDAVAIDSCFCRAYGYTSDNIPMLVKCAELNLGCANFAEIDRKGDGWENIFNAKAKRSRADLFNRLPEPLFHFLTYILNCRPEIFPEKCVRCGICAKACSQQAIQQKNDRYLVRRSKCILCMCCLEACPHQAIELTSPGIKIRRFFSKIFKSCYI